MSSSQLMISVSGIRGVVGSALLPAQALDFVSAYAAYLRNQGIAQPRVLLARDSRTTGDMMRHAALSALIASGCEVFDLGVVPTPTLQFAIPQMQADGAICITASHNPVEWNALKFFQPSGMYLDKEQGAEVLKIYDQRAFLCNAWDAMGRVQSETEAGARHLARAIELVDAERIRARRFKVVLDACNGAAWEVSPQILRELGCDVVVINGEPTGVFAHNPEPLNENMTQLCAAVKSHGADIGFAHDADADRVAVVTNEGEPIGEDYSLVWGIAAVLSSRERGPVVTNLSTTMAVEATAQRFNCEVQRSAVGDANVSGLMRQIGAVVGGEGNGGVIWPEMQFGRDGIAAIALLLEYLAREEKTSAEVGRALPRFAISKSTLQFPREHTNSLFQWLKSREKGALVDERDGLKLSWPQNPKEPSGGLKAWAHIRASGTEPFVRVICEAHTEAEAARIQKTMRGEIAALALAF